MSGCEAAGRYLEQLLAREPAYRRVWQARCERSSRKRVNRTAVARVLMEHVWDAGELEVESERQLLDRTRRALDGTVLEPRTLQWFVDAFGIGPEHEQELRRLLLGDGGRAHHMDFIVGGFREGPHLGPPEPLPWRTLTINEYHELGADGLPVANETFQIIEAREDGLAQFPYTFDTHEVEVAGVWGGTPGPVVPCEGPWHRVYITFDAPLRKGQLQWLRYRTLFRYRTAPKPCFRRGTRQRIDHLTMRVQFHPSRLPRQVWWCRWDSPDGCVVDQVPWQLDADHSIGSVHAGVKQAIVGFRWEW